MEKTIDEILEELRDEIGAMAAEIEDTNQTLRDVLAIGDVLTR